MQHDLSGDHMHKQADLRGGEDGSTPVRYFSCVILCLCAYFYAPRRTQIRVHVLHAKQGQSSKQLQADFLIAYLYMVTLLHMKLTPPREDDKYFVSFFAPLPFC